MTFSELNLHPLILDALNSKNFTEPSPIQKAAIPPLLENPDQDALLLAATGTGKTAAYGLPMIHHLNSTGEKNTLRGLVIVPTRELCIQVGESLAAFSSRIPGFSVCIVYGGASIGLQARALSKKPSILVATPGRLLDLVMRKDANLSGIERLVLDEGDELLTPGFLEDIRKIQSYLPENHTRHMVSATLPDTIRSEVFSLLRNPAVIKAEDSPEAPDRLEHICHCMRERHRFPALLRVLQAHPGARALIFCRTRKESQELTERLTASGFPAEALHGDLSQAQRETTVNRFRADRFRLLVATNVAARGIDLPGLPLVIHYRLPEVSETYTHRSGRTARAGHSGIAVALISPEERGRMAGIARRTGLAFVPTPLPDASAIQECQLAHLADTIKNSRSMDESLITEAEKHMATCSREDLIRALLAAHAPSLVSLSQTQEKLDAPMNSARPAPGRPFQKNHPAQARSNALCRCFVNAGTLDGLTPASMTRFIAKNAGIQAGRIRKIDMRREFSFVDVDPDVAVILKKNVRDIPLGTRSVSVKALAPRKNARPDYRKQSA
ncbi:ATP-dependent RNA helicase DeaD [Desulfobotulus alkaliphilus]|uniref:ATP-dependent RNA helicase DeaD n=1 Tax=Desulfobotulus alkaliphilus TaxID=622671 RepID=A0A562S6H3_9BACT|nr:DEAD/DEAH box helicase [Desulfobotulus alkaliphilus]TWI76932.1 ATP-dependent RNA helicase DeaD [Desulfobotulus alkaliphilus]